jgi:hypothetical protein
MRLTEAAKRMKKPILVVVMLAMVAVAIVPALAQDGEFDVIQAEERPVATCAWGPTEISSPENPYAPNALDPSDHQPGVFFVTYESVDAMWAAPQENVRETSNSWGWYETDTGTVYYPIPDGSQELYFEDIASIPDPCERFAAEEAKRQEILTWPGVKYAEYASIGTVD